MRRALVLAAALPLFAAEPAPDPHRGLYAIGLRPGQSANYPFLAGGQVVVQWRDVEPREGTYDFASIDRQLEAMQKLRRPAMVQINGNEHPEWMFSRIPYIERKLSSQVRDARGTLAYWHPVYQQAYRRMVRAFGQHLRSSPLREAVLGVRANLNAIGTDDLDVPEPDCDPARWTVPQSTPQVEAWTPAVAQDYRRDVIDNFTEAFAPDVRVILPVDVAGHPDRGRPEQLNYWRLLADLGRGASFIALDGADLEHAEEPEFRAAFEFAALYAGYRTIPSAAPGAWVALREGGDCTYLMKRSGEMAAVEKPGPAGQRFGAWGRRLDAGRSARFDVDPGFARSLKGEATIRVVYLDQGTGAMTIACGATRQKVELGNSGNWMTASLRTDASSGQIVVSAGGAVTLHMVEVRR